MIPKIHECLANDELRPAMNYALVTKEETAASDAHIMVVHRSAEIFTDPDFLEEIPEKGILIGKEALKDLALQDVHHVEYTEVGGNLIIVTHAPNRGASFRRYFEVLLNGDEYTFVDYNKVWPKKEDKQKGGVESIGFNSTLLAKLEKALGATTGVNLEFYSPMKAIVVRGKGSEEYTQAKGLIMPMMNV